MSERFTYCLTGANDTDTAFLLTMFSSTS
jgi:hypothetical protein